MDVEARIRSSFERQKVMATFGCVLESVAPGAVTIRMPFREDLTQQHGFLHAGVVTTVVDSACGYSALSMMPEGAGVLSIEFKVNLLAPARGEAIIARAKVVKAGRTISVVSGEVFALRDGQEHLCTTMVGTMMVVKDRPGLSD